jgi:hypothetical protein
MPPIGAPICPASSLLALGRSIEPAAAVRSGTTTERGTPFSSKKT